MRFSVIVPAHNEAQWLPRALASITAAGTRVDGPVEVVVVANRCSDDTAALAAAADAVVIESPARNVAAVRNAGAGVATGDTIVTIDADCVMSSTALRAVEDLLDSGKYVGGGSKVRPERSSVGIRTTYAVMEVITFVMRVSGGMFWCPRRDYEAIGGFDERVVIAEDLDFARRLRAHGRRTGRRFTKLRSAPVIASTRKFDRFGDWHMFTMVRQLPDIRAALNGTDTTWADRYFFDFND